ncbi:MAG TPA: Hpt domain-containing protein [Polyangiaceae bacterium]
MNSGSPQHVERYRQLVAEYIDSFGDKLAALERSMTAGKSGDAAGLAEAREIAHRMHGTAGCYGFRELSAAAAELDDVLTKMKRGEGGSWDAAERAAQPVIEMVRAVMQSRRA